MEYKKNFSDSLSLTPSSLGSSTLSSTTSAASSATSSATTSTSTTSIFSEIQKKATNFFNNKYLRAVLYLILILYASLIAPKLPDWIIPYLEYPIVKIFIIFIIGLLATQDPTAAIIATIGVTITYLFMNDLQNTKRLQDIKNKEEKERKEEKEKKKMCVIQKKSIEPFYSYAELMKDNKENKVNKVSDSCNSYKIDDNQYADSKYASVEPVRHIEHFDVMHNNNCFINHTVEHFNKN